MIEPEHHCLENLDNNCQCKICGKIMHDFNETKNISCNRFQCGYSWFYCGQVECPPDIGKIITVEKKCKRCGYETREEYEE